MIGGELCRVMRVLSDVLCGFVDRHRLVRGCLGCKGKGLVPLDASCLVAVTVVLRTLGRLERQGLQRVDVGRRRGGTT